MATLNQLLKEKREALEPKRVYPCDCEFKCERFGGDSGECENCSYCGTDGGSRDYSSSDFMHMEKL